MNDPTVHTGYVLTPHPEGDALRAELELAAERLQAATQGLIDSGLLPPAPTGSATLWHRVARTVHQEMHHEPGDPCQRCVDWTRAAMAEVQPELAKLAAEVRWLRKTKTQLTEGSNRLVAEVQAARGRVEAVQSAVRVAVAGLDGMVGVLQDDHVLEGGAAQLGEFVDRFKGEYQALLAALADDAPAAEPAAVDDAAAVLDVRVMRALTTQRDQAVNDLDRVTGERDRLVREMELIAVETRLLSEANGLLSSTLDHAGAVFVDKETGLHGWQCVLCDWVGRGLDSEKAAYQELGRHWSTVDHDSLSAREELAALHARVRELLGPIGPELADAPASTALPPAEVVVGGE